MGNGKTEPQPVARKRASVDDEVSRALLQVQGLIEAAKGRRSPAGPAHSVRILERDEDVIGVSGRLAEGARRDVSVIVQAAASQAGAVALELMRSASAAGPAGGARVRLLCAPAVVRAAAFREALAGAAGCVVRVAECALNEAVVVDGSVAVLWSGPRGGDKVVSLVEDPAPVTALAALFAAVWNGATVWEAGASRARSETGQRILEALRDGRTDAAAARELSIPLRTYRRYVAEIMRELGADSRFQAGVCAVWFGLLKKDE